MASLDGFRAFALSLPKVVEKPHFDRTSFRVDAPKGKIFATMPANGESANLMLSRDEQDMLCAAEPALFTPVPNKWGEKGATVFHFPKADSATLHSALTLAWKRAAPERLWGEVGGAT